MEGFCRSLYYGVCLGLLASDYATQPPTPQGLIQKSDFVDLRRNAGKKFKVLPGGSPSGLGHAAAWAVKTYM